LYLEYLLTYCTRRILFFTKHRPLVSDHDDDNDEHISPKKAAHGNVYSTKDAAGTDDALEADFANCILKCKSVYKCKLCPRILCLNEEMVRLHLKSKVTSEEGGRRKTLEEN
jgi:hypothetical protein